MSGIRRALICLLALATCGLAGCEAAQNALDELFPRTGPRTLSDDDAFEHLRVDRTAAPQTEVAAVQRVIDREVARSMGVSNGSSMMDPGAADVLARTVQARLAMDEQAFDLVDFEANGARFEAGQKANCAFEVPMDQLQSDDFLIPHVEKIPVRNQGGRGTCAAFAGIGSVEYSALNPTDGEEGFPGLPTLDLSEQRFYFESKPDCQGPSGCECPGCQEGSWYGVGFNASEQAANNNIPLETDCPYNNRPGANDTQYPQLGSCESGAARVEEMGTWCGLDDLVDLLNRGYAVPYASPLSANWERNDGLITFADFEGAGSTVHAGGHAYLVVGYKRLPDMPEEGGVCFYIKNSWGTGWGVNGYSCMTLAWMQAVNFDGFIAGLQPVPLKVALRDDLMQEGLPDNNEEAEDNSEPDVPDDEPIDDEELDPLPPDDLDLDPDPEEEEPAPEPEPGPDPEPEPEPDPGVQFETARLRGPNETFYRVEVASVDNELRVRGLVRGGGETRAVRVITQNDRLLYDGDEVGRVQGDMIELCTQSYAALCSLRLRTSDNQLYLQFRDDDLRAVQSREVSSEQGDWLGVDLGNGRNYQLFIPNDVTSTSFLSNPKTFLRVGQSTMRLSLERAANISELAEVAIKLQGINVGQLNLSDPFNSALCSGDAFGDTCELVEGATQLRLIPRNRRRQSTRGPGQPIE